MCPVGFILLDRTHIYFDIFRLTAQAFGLTARCGGSHLKLGLVRTTASRLSKLRLIASVTSDTQDMQKPLDTSRPFCRSEKSSQQNRLTVMFTCGQTSKPPGQALRHSRFHLLLTAAPPPHTETTITVS